MAKKKRQDDQQHGDRTISVNRKAYHDYTIEDTIEAGIVLAGSEIKSVRAGRVSLREAYVTIRGGEAWMIGGHIAGYQQAGRQDHDPTRDRKLLLHKRQILRWQQYIEQRGYTIVPLKMYLKNGRAKLEIGLARGKRQYDKRQAIRERETQRSIDRAIKEQMR